MKFEDWKKQRKYVNLHEELSDLVFAEQEWGFVYPNECYIDDALTWGCVPSAKGTVPGGRWSLIIGNHQWASDDLSKMEGVLYDWYKTNCLPDS